MFIQRGPHTAIVSADGGSVLQWQYNEHMILGPSGIVRVGNDLKTRGVTHWCLPQFGSAPEGDERFGSWPKHGFIRHTQLTPSRFENGVVHTGTVRSLVGMDWIADVTTITGFDTASLLGAHPDSVVLEMGLDVNNATDEALPVLPAVHPYFNTEGGVQLTIDGQPVNVDHELTTPLRVPAAIAVLSLGCGFVTIVPPDDCEMFVVWTDNPARYVCVEPVFGVTGTFGNERSGRYLGRTISCSVRMTFQPR